MGDDKTKRHFHSEIGIHLFNLLFQTVLKKHKKISRPGCHASKEKKNVQKEQLSLFLISQNCKNNETIGGGAATGPTKKTNWFNYNS